MTILVLVASGCGFKTAPVPPQTVVPEPIVDLLHTIDGDSLTLSWSYPVETVKGTAIEDISSFDLYRAEIPLASYCATCPIPFGEPLEIPGGAVLDGELRSRAVYESKMLKSGYKYFFKVTSRTSWLAASEDSNIVTFVYYQPAAAPDGFAANAGDGEIRLSWQPVTQLMDGSKIPGPLSYRLFRSTGGKGFERIGGTLTATSFVDRPVVNGQKYFYAVQSFMEYRGEVVPGGRSEEISAMPVDRTPPPPPSGVTAVATGVGVKIFWNKSLDGDLGGFHVYRRASDSDDYELLGKVEPQFNLFVDSTAKEGIRYYYAVTSFDTATPPNESIKSREATIR